MREYTAEGFIITPSVDVDLRNITTLEIRFEVLNPVADTIYNFALGGAMLTHQLSLGVTEWNPSSNAGNFTLPITTGGTWTATSDTPAWLSVSPATGIGNGSAVIYVTENTSIYPRAGNITVTVGSETRTFPVSQAGAPVKLEVDPPALSFPAEGGYKGVAVNSNIGWTVSVPAAARTWLSVTPGSGNGPNNITITTQPNTAVTARSATITLTGEGETRTIFVMQDGTGIQITVDPNNLSFTPQGESHTVRITTNVIWTVTNNASSWVTVTPMSGDDDGYITVSATENTGSSQRTGTIIVTTSSGASSLITVTQNGVPISS